MFNISSCSSGILLFHFALHKVRSHRRKRKVLNNWNWLHNGKINIFVDSPLLHRKLTFHKFSLLKRLAWRWFRFLWWTKPDEGRFICMDLVECSFSPFSSPFLSWSRQVLMLFVIFQWISSTCRLSLYVWSWIRKPTSYWNLHVFVACYFPWKTEWFSSVLYDSNFPDSIWILSRVIQDDSR